MNFLGGALIAAVASLVASEASAAPFDITIAAATLPNGTLNATIVGDTSSNFVSLGYREKSQVRGILFTETTSFSDLAAPISFGNAVTSIDSFGFTNVSQLYTITDTAFPFEVIDRNGSPSPRGGFTFEFTLFQRTSPSGVVSYRSSSSRTVLGSAYDILSSRTIVSDSLTPPVPLPASAPMFGAALLALGAVGYGIKRKKAAAA